MELFRIFLLLIFTKLVCSLYCNDGTNLCQLDEIGLIHSYFTPEYGYYCLDGFDGQVICTCPDNSTTRNRPCRICDRKPNPCGESSSVVSCTDINLSFSCLCNDGLGGLIVSTKPCGSIPGTTVSPGESCLNNGVRDPTLNQCNCPSGYRGNRCEVQIDSELCDGIICLSNGVCGIRPILIGGTEYQSKCLCPIGSDGEYCEKQSIIGNCSPTYCLNRGICEERRVGNSVYITCQCQPGWIGSRCQKQYFRCESSGYFIDEYLKNQGKYFICAAFNNDLLLKQRSCSKGLKFNLEKKLCLR